MHEIKNKGMDNQGHRGKRTTDIRRYYNAADKFDEAEWAHIINIMNADALAVPMNNGGATLPGGGTAGPIDRFYFYSIDVHALREL